ncbi:hypothetical protein MC7420_5316 [Coleofasciculus chthonoplastes PCC 7420]|uniref:Uncharacterized protein n=1 Tax=Coleofasciculus chthonoplastes PCC 7420 TaxID=118168 RepID=B4W559_9CYAN|nr:hypothetical protein [Coleofasciculus chthonoplastes]EDX70688.1 hypothetical protein MC7420_5316 [Coleofasciculus chthonoplastes PCC 7420]
MARLYNGAFVLINVSTAIEAQVKGIVHEYLQQPFEGREEEQRQLDEFVQNNSKGVLLVSNQCGGLLRRWR